MSRGSENDIQRYYDRNTRRFLRYGHGKTAAAIHRAVWAPGVESRREAMEYVNARVLDVIMGSRSTAVLDLGCGVGGTLLYLWDRYAAEYSGLTLSPVQAQIADELIQEFAGRQPANNRENRPKVLQGDFHDSQAISGVYDTVYAVESMIHARDTRQVLSSVASHLQDKGTFIVCDDFLSDTEESGEPNRRNMQRKVARFQRGWHAPGLVAVSEFIATAGEVGLTVESDDDLTEYLELGRPRDVAIRMVMATLAWLPITTAWWANMLGGDALQYCLARHWIQYHLLVFRKTVSPST